LYTEQGHRGTVEGRWERGLAKRIRKRDKEESWEKNRKGER